MTAAYLAGPDVFLPEARQWAERKKAICARHGLIGVSPLDPLPDQPSDWAALPEWQRIALRNETQIRGCDAMIANLTPFRGPSADVGTVYEVGFVRALGLRYSAMRRPRPGSRSEHRTSPAGRAARLPGPTGRCAMPRAC